MFFQDTVPAKAAGPDDNCPEISVIVPIYKVEKYLRECLDSIMNQTFTSWECILVDDGSPDASGEICEEYAARDSRFKVLHRENGGLSAARNSGMAVSRGKYIGFVDSDDVAHPTMLEHLYLLIREYDADVAQVSYEYLFVSGSKDMKLVEEVTVLDRGEVARELMRNRMIPSYMWNKLFRREVITEPFPEGIIFEDLRTLASWAPNICNMVLSPDVLYSYRQRAGSIVNSDYSKNRIEYLQAIVDRAKVLHRLEPLAVSREMMEKAMWKGAVVAGKNIARYVKGSQSRAEGIERLRKICDSFPAPNIDVLGLKLWWRVELLLKSPAAFISNMRMIYLFNSHKRHRSERMFT